MANTILQRTKNGNEYQWDALLGVPPSTPYPTTSARSLWDAFPRQAVASDPGYGQLYRLNSQGVTFASNTIPGWTFTQATSGTITLDTAKGVKFDTGAVTAGQGVNWQQTYVNGIIATNKNIWLEAQFNFTALTSLKLQFLFGLAVAGTTLITGNAVGTESKIAFDCVTTTGAVLCDVNTSGTNTTAAAFTIANSGTYVLGIIATTTQCLFFVNRILVQTITTNIPANVALTPSIVLQGNATVEPIVFMPWLQYGSLY